MESITAYDKLKGSDKLVESKTKGQLVFSTYENWSLKQSYYVTFWLLHEYILQLVWIKIYILKIWIELSKISLLI